MQQRTVAAYGDFCRLLPSLAHDEILHLFVDLERRVTRPAHRLHGNVVVRRADPSAGDDVVYVLRELDPLVCDLLLVVADDYDLREGDADVLQGTGGGVGVGVGS